MLGRDRTETVEGPRMTMEEILDLETGIVSETRDVPEDLSYLEIDLPKD